MNRYDSVTAIGVDVHYKFSQVSMRDSSGKVVVRERLDHQDRDEVRRRLRQWPKVPVVLEASFGWSWLTDEMKAAGLKPMLSNCYKVEQMRKAHSYTKTNKKDADLLAMLPAEAEPWWRVWMAPPEVRDHREVLRLRSSLVGLQTGTKNRIWGVFHRHGIFHDLSDLFGTHGRELLAELCARGRTKDVQLATGALAYLRHQVELLMQIRNHLAGIGSDLRHRLEEDPLIRRIDGIPGFGLILSHTLVSEVGDIRRFARHGSLANYSLLAPICRDTGEQDPDQKPQGRHLGRRGNRTLKWTFIEAAHGAVRSGGTHRELFDYVTHGGRENCNRGYIKVARELVKSVHVVWSKNVEYSEHPACRPGSLTSASTRPGTGQLKHPMAVVHM